MSVKSINEFLESIARLYLMYKDFTFAFFALNKYFPEKQMEVSDKLGIPIEELDKRAMVYSSGDPGDPSTKLYPVIRTTQGSTKERNKKGGVNYRYAAHYFIVLMYQYWENYYRQKIAVDKGFKEKNEVKSDIMGDIRILRNLILKHRAIADKRVEKLKILKWFKEGDQIIINEDKFDIIINNIFRDMETLKSRR